MLGDLLDLSGAAGNVSVDGFGGRGGFRGAVSDFLEFGGLGRGLLLGIGEDFERPLQDLIVRSIEADRA
ncbi:hypothetical protein ACH4OY_31850 [Micromonospora rubida]|uniref:Uncharacterized protein n=1 Tax=Micromonospora rubida TaxID=2697657 RepID=A0ABW7SU34_9ACTN